MFRQELDHSGNPEIIAFTSHKQYHFLNSDFLILHEVGSTQLEFQTSMSFAFLTIPTRTFHSGGVSWSIDHLVDFTTTGVTKISDDISQGHDFGAANDDSTKRHESSDELGTDFSRS